MHCNLLTEVKIAQETGHQPIEIVGSKLYRFAQQGFSTAEALSQRDGLPAAALEYVQDIER